MEEQNHSPQGQEVEKREKRGQVPQCPVRAYAGTAGPHTKPHLSKVPQLPRGTPPWVQAFNTWAFEEHLTKPEKKGQSARMKGLQNKLHSRGKMEFRDMATPGGCEALRRGLQYPFHKHGGGPV